MPKTLDPRGSWDLGAGRWKTRSRRLEAAQGTACESTCSDTYRCWLDMSLIHYSGARFAVAELKVAVVCLLSELSFSEIHGEPEFIRHGGYVSDRGAGLVRAERSQDGSHSTTGR
jgi:hypothetical protein